MKPAKFQYHRPRTVGETVEILAEVAPEFGRVLAGGQSLVPTMAFRLAQPAHLVDINGVEGLDRLAVEGDELSIGACVRHVTFHRPVMDGQLGRLLAFVVPHIAHYQIRMRGTFGGSLAHADPASEWCLVAATLDAKIVARSIGNARVVPAADYFRGVMTTALEAHELLAEVRLPILTDDTRFGFFEFSRRVGDYALAMALVVYRMQHGVIVEPRIGIGGVESLPRRLHEAETALAGSAPIESQFLAAAEIAAEVIDPIGDAQAGVDYRRDLTRTVICRALKRALP